ncbi:MAG: Uma2 family endonuclease [Deltaproteobacteria bacterium]|nr:Uma2 family endonuclease [Deltaproteobacteria bacterium]
MPAAARERSRQPNRATRTTGVADAKAGFDWSRWYLFEADDEGETLHHSKVRSVFYATLLRWLAERGHTTAEVVENVFIRWVPHEPNVQISPDVALFDRVPVPWPTCFDLWKPDHEAPRVALEVVSTDWRKDYADNPPKYHQLGCKELIIYDPEHDLHPRTKDRVALQVFRAVEGRFDRVYAGRGPAFSAELGAWLVEVGTGDGRRLRLATDAAGAQLVPTAEESDAAQRLRAQAEAELRMAAEAEIARLRAELDSLRKP